MCLPGTAWVCAWTDAELGEWKKRVCSDGGRGESVRINLIRFGGSKNWRQTIQTTHTHTGQEDKKPNVYTHHFTRNWFHWLHIFHALTRYHIPISWKCAFCMKRFFFRTALYILCRSVFSWLVHAIRFAYNWTNKMCRVELVDFCALVCVIRLIVLLENQLKCIKWRIAEKNGETEIERERKREIERALNGKMIKWSGTARGRR